LLGGLDVVVSDFNATAVAALAGGAELPLVVPGLGGAEALVVGAAAGGGFDAAMLEMPGFGATDEEPNATAAGFGATEEVAGTGGPGETGLGAGTDPPVLGTNALGAREGVAAGDFVKRGGAGIEVSPVAGPGPSGATGCTGIVVEGEGGASSRHASASWSKLRSVFRPQIGQSQPTSNRF
jgi:hypothetical protein